MDLPVGGKMAHSLHKPRRGKACEGKNFAWKKTWGININKSVDQPKGRRRVQTLFMGGRTPISTEKGYLYIIVFRGGDV